jgi:hypothetical protein
LQQVGIFSLGHERVIGLMIDPSEGLMTTFHTFKAPKIQKITSPPSNTKVVFFLIFVQKKVTGPII